MLGSFLIPPPVKSKKPSVLTLAFTKKLHTMINDSFCNHHDSRAHRFDVSDQDWQYALMLGYCDRTQPSGYGFSPSPDHYTQNMPCR